MALTKISQAGAKDEAINEAKIQISNAGTNGQYLQKQSGNAGGLTWADVPAGVGGGTGLDVNDSVKIRLGTGNDLEIYHNGTDSNILNSQGDLYIHNTGANADDINIRAQDDINLQVQNGEAGINIIGDGAVELYYDNSKKFETTSAGATITRDLTLNHASGDTALRWAVGGTNKFSLYESGGTLRFYDNTNSAERLHIDSSGNVGIGTTSPADKLHIVAGSQRNFVVRSTGGSVHLYAQNDSGNVEDLTIGGNNVILKAGTGSAGSEVARISEHGGITFNGDTAAANALDDYEEGTWTPASNSNATLSSANGSYTKIGRLVFVWFNIQINQINSGSQNTIFGLPFTCSPDQAFGQHGYFASLTFTPRSLVPYAGNGTNIMFHAINNSDTFLLNADLLGNGSRVDGSIVYQTSS